MITASLPCFAISISSSVHLGVSTNSMINRNIKLTIDTSTYKITPFHLPFFHNLIRNSKGYKFGIIPSEPSGNKGINGSFVLRFVPSFRAILLKHAEQHFAMSSVNSEINVV